MDIRLTPPNAKTLLDLPPPPAALLLLPDADIRFFLLRRKKGARLANKGTTLPRYRFQ